MLGFFVVLDNCHVSMVHWIWIVVWLVTTQVSRSLALLIFDEIESHLPIGRRPSWRLWHIGRLPLAEVKLHAKMFPTRRALRLWWVLTTIGSYVLAVVGIAALIITSPSTHN